MSFLKRIFGSDEIPVRSTTVPSMSPDIQPLAESLKKKYANGINYNMKIVIRGDRGVGKSSLLARLKGGPFVGDYIPSTEIQAASVRWDFQNTSDVIKVDVWDVVDKGQPRPPPHPARNQHGLEAKIPLPGTCLDAAFLNVYKGADGVILMMDMTKSWTFDYVRQELPRVPSHLPVLIMANCRDLNQHRSVSADDVRRFLDSEASECRMARGQDSDPASHLLTGGQPVGRRRIVPVQYCEASMRNGFGLLYLHKFFGLPFLSLKRCILQQQLARNQADLDRIVGELDDPSSPLSTSPEAYEAYLRPVENRTGVGKQRTTTSSRPASKAEDRDDPPLSNGQQPMIDKTQGHAKQCPSNPMVLSIQDDIDSDQGPGTDGQTSGYQLQQTPCRDDDYNYYYNNNTSSSDDGDGDEVGRAEEEASATVLVESKLNQQPASMSTASSRSSLGCETRPETRIEELTIDSTDEQDVDGVLVFDWDRLALRTETPGRVTGTFNGVQQGDVISAATANQVPEGSRGVPNSKELIAKPVHTSASGNEISTDRGDVFRSPAESDAFERFLAS